MKLLLQQDFSAAHDPAQKQHPVNEEQKQNDFSFRDPKACDACRPFFKEGCNYEVFLIHSPETVTYINIEDFINGFNNIHGDRCDGLLYDTEKVVLFDMYCGMSDYLDAHMCDGKPEKGKKSKVKGQIEETIERLDQIPSIATFFKDHKSRIAIFAYRTPYDEIFQTAPQVVQNSGNKMLAMARMIQNRELSLPMKCGFRYIAVKYPSRYQW